MSKKKTALNSAIEKLKNVKSGIINDIDVENISDVDSGIILGLDKALSILQSELPTERQQIVDAVIYGFEFIAVDP